MPTPQGDITSTETWSETPEVVEEEVEVVIKDEDQEQPE